MKKNLGHRSQASSYDTRKGQQILSTKIRYKNGQNSQQATILGPWRLTESKQHIEKHLILKNSQNLRRSRTEVCGLLAQDSSHPSQFDQRELI